MSNFKVFLLALLSSSFCAAEQVELKVYTGNGETLTHTPAQALLVDTSGLLMMGLPNNLTITKVTYQDQSAETPAILVSYNNYSRIAFIRLPQEKMAGKKPTQLVEKTSGGVSVKGKKHLIAGEVTHHDGKSIPFSFTRIHSEEAKTPLFSFVKNDQNQCTAIIHSEVPKSESAYYAVPAHVLQKSLTDIKKFGQPTRAWVGITLNANVSLPVVKSVRPESAAAKAGLKKGDILKKLAGRDVNSYDDAVKSLYLTKAEEQIQVQIIRGAQALTMNLTPQKLPGSKPLEE